ncbi:helix-turn-helix domain-containing protein [Herbiconiux flava]|uniref:Transcriptional regulator with XRE-family HTH domain n=1 Tax=Herbiconiux flava TaxID=881268 RepID=A0A852SMB9_9MICO|nr:helix-turn-helix domain-containing protein [Herbiconiux flava]NYD69677.1 transcriptional regulator with XRE-family HTH domain [Herbiconiux flava]GLK16424.1 transcriptional regulator ClgR [Herbiconiux flava]
MLLRHAIGHVLRRLRLERGLTLRRLAERSRISLPYLSEIERGRKEASSEILATLCRVLDVSAGELLTSSAAVLAEDDSRSTRPVAPVLAEDDARSTRPVAPVLRLDLGPGHALAGPAVESPGASALLLAA